MGKGGALSSLGNYNWAEWGGGGYLMEFQLGLFLVRINDHGVAKFKNVHF